MKTLFPWMIVWAVLTVVAVPAAKAGEGQFEFHGGVLSATDDSEGANFSYGVRGGYRFNGAWGLEGSVSRSKLVEIDVLFIDIDANVTNVEVSAKRFFNTGKKAEAYVLAGPGRVSYAIDINGISIATYDDAFSFHVGGGAQINLGERMYLRPDLRLRWTDQLGDDVAVEASLGIGWRFGGGR